MQVCRRSAHISAGRQGLLSLTDALHFLNMRCARTINVPAQVCRSLIVLITNAPGLHAYSARSLYRSLKSNLVSDRSPPS